MITLKKTFVGAFIAMVAFLGMSSAAQALTQQELLAQALDAGWSFDQFNQAYEMAFGGSNSGSNDGSATCGTTTYGYTATSTLRPGMSGMAVSTLQSALNNYAGASLSTDGAYGPATASAVMAFQASKGLGQDGVMGPISQGALVNASMMTGGDCDGSDDSDNNSDLNGGAGDLTYSASSEFSG